MEHENIGYENRVIINIIEDIRELLDDEFFKFKINETEDSITENNHE